MVISALRTFVTGTSCLALLAGMATAQEAEQGRYTFLGTISVSENAENPTAPMMGSVAHTAAATKTGASILETQSSVSVINRTEMERHAATSLAEALGYSAGVATENFGGDPRFDSLYLRGFNLENDKFLDGLRLMRSTQYPTSAPAFEIYGLERVEILRGPTSVLYGSGSPAGIVNMVQKRAQATGDFTEGGASVATNKGWAVFGDANRVVNDRFAYRLTVKRGAQNTDVKEIGDQSTYVGFSSSYQLSDTTEIEVMASHQKDGPGSPTGVPGAMARSGDLDDLRKIYFGDKSVDKSDRRMSTLSFGATHDFQNGWKGSATLRYTRFKWDYDNIYVSGGTPTVAMRGLGKQVEKFTALAADIRLSGDVITGAVDHKLTFGVDAQKLRESARTKFYYARDFDITAPQYGGNVVGDQWYNADKHVNAHQVALYAIDEVRMGQWRGTFGLRHEWTRQTGQSLTNYGNTDYTRDNEATVGHVAVGYDWDEQLTSYVSYATSYLPQPGVDIDNNPLKPTKGKQWELGAKYDPIAFDGLFTAALFDLRETDRNTNVAEGGLSGVRQIGKARVRGLELEGAADLDDNWSLKGTYSYTKTDVMAGDNNGKELKNVPKQMASMWLSYRFEQGVTLGGGVRYLGARWGNDANTTRLNAVTLVDLGASYEFGNGVTARLNVNNVMDKAYIAGAGSFADYLGDGRTVQASLTYKW